LYQTNSNSGARLAEGRRWGHQAFDSAILNFSFSKDADRQLLSYENILHLLIPGMTKLCQETLSICKRQRVRIAELA
jgi:hypothetical protein